MKRVDVYHLRCDAERIANINANLRPWPTWWQRLIRFLTH